MGHEESEKFICNNQQKVHKNERCLFEYDEYNIQVGCRDMSHLISCGNLLNGSNKYGLNIKIFYKSR